MKTITRIVAYALCGALFMSQVAMAGSYEVNILSGHGSESRALEKGQYAKAIERLEQRVANGEHDIDIKMTNLCTAYVVTGKFDKAIPTCDRAIEMNGRFVGVAYNSRGVLHARLGDYVTALADFSQAQNASRTHHGATKQFCAKCPGNSRFYEEGEEYQHTLAIAARNLHEADVMWANVQTKKSKKAGSK